MEKKQTKVVGKVFVVVGDKRKCVVCDRVFTTTQAANHATTLCCPSSEERLQH